MDWILEHFQLLFVVGGIIAYWLNQRRREKAGEEADYDGDGIPDVPRRKIDPNQPDPEEAERQRRIQEDIRRKILQRSGQDVPPHSPPAHVPAPPSPTIHREPASPPQRQMRPRAPRPMDPPTPAAPGPLPEVFRRMLDPHGEHEAEDRARAEASGRANSERLAHLQEDREAAREQEQRETVRAAAFRAAQAEANARSSIDARSVDGSVVESLRDPNNLRRAIILREVLGPPVGMR